MRQTSRAVPRLLLTGWVLRAAALCAVFPFLAPAATVVSATTAGVSVKSGAPPHPGEVGDWPCWRGVHRDGMSRETGWLAKWPKSGPRKLWEARVGVGYSPVSVSGGRAYTMGKVAKRETVIWCLDAAKGNVLWKRSVPTGRGSGYPGPRAQPTVDGDRAYTLSLLGSLQCLTAAKGEVLWEIDLRKKLGASGEDHYGHCENPVILGNALIIETGAPPATVIAFNKMTGKVLWKGGQDPGGYSTPAPYVRDGKLCLAVLTGKSLLGMDASNGTVLWRYPWKSKNGTAVATPIVSDDKVFISCDYGYGSAFVQMTDKSPKEIWRSTNMSNHFMTCVLYREHVYGFTPRVRHSVSKKTVLRCVELKTGNIKWEKGGLGIGTLLVADGKLILLGDAGDLVIAEAISTEYKEISRAKVVNERCWTMPTLARGRIYCRGEKGQLVCIDVSRTSGGAVSPPSLKAAPPGVEPW